MEIIVGGFPAYCNENTFVLNNVISFVAYKMYKYKMKCRVLRVKINKHQAFHGKWKNYFLKSCLYIIEFNLLHTKSLINNDFCNTMGLVSKEIYFLSYGCTNL